AHGSPDRTFVVQPFRHSPGEITISTRPRTVQVAALVDPNITINFEVASKDATRMGSFGGGSKVRQLSLFVSSRLPDRVLANVRSPLPNREAEGWAIAIFAEWSDYLYRVHTVRNELGRWPTLFIVLIADDSGLVLAPADYEWDEAGIGAIARPIKLAPKEFNRELRDRLIRYGDVTPVARKTH
ncbi:hypothetical protein, partial [Rhodococcus sp. NPDC058521]|uniref:hypothetical protein n=1 Tax=Rhodococcus sp. NPDC058521 TaxID=3346536 RepID=UPI00364998D3